MSEVTIITPFYSPGLSELSNGIPIYIGDRIEDSVATRLICFNRTDCVRYEWMDAMMEACTWTYEGLVQTVAELFKIEQDKLSTVTLYIGSDEINNRILRPNESIYFANDPVIDVIVAPSLY